MPRERDYIDLEGRSASDIFDQIRERRTEFPGRDYKLAFDVQEMKGGGFRASVRYCVDVTAEKRLNSVTPRDDFRNVVRSGQSITYFASQAQREAFDAAIEHDEFALEERLTTIKDLDWGKSTVLDALKESTLPGVAADYGVSNEEIADVTTKNAEKVFAL